MDSFAIIVLLVIILSFVAVTLIMKLRYRLPWKDFFQSVNDPDYNLLSIVHRRYAKVRAGKQTFERYRTEMLADYDAEHFQKEKSEFKNNQKRRRLNRLADMLDNEAFIRKYFDNPKFYFSDCMAMLDEWDQMPEYTAAAEDQKENKPEQVEVVDESPAVARTIEGKTDMSFKDILLEGTPEFAETYSEKYVMTRRKAKELVNLYFAFQTEKYVNCDWKTFYYALRNSFPEYIVVEERTFRQAEKERRNVKVSYEMTENARVETEIISHIEKGLNP